MGPSAKEAGAQPEVSRHVQLIRDGLSRLDLDTWKQNMIRLASMGGVMGVAAAGALSPMGPGTCDHNPLERCANCVTSAPYLACGLHTFRNRRTVSGKAWGVGLMGVGACSVAFHASTGRARPTCRKLDFWSIAGASNIMLRAVYPRIPPVVTALGLMATPFKPFFVSTACTTAMEIKYLVQAYKKPHLRPAQCLHTASCLLGLSCYIMEDLYPKMPLLHSAWHCLSSGAVATINNLVAEVEEDQMAAASGSIKKPTPTVSLPASHQLWDSATQLAPLTQRSSSRLITP